MQLRADYAQELGEDVSAAENIQGEEERASRASQSPMLSPQPNHGDDDQEYKGSHPLPIGLAILYK